MTRRIDQVMAGFADGDAISHEAIALRGTFRSWGFASDIFADRAHVSPSMAADVRGLDELSAGPGDHLLHHYGIASPALDAFAASPAHKLLVYHNVTPAEYFDGFDDRVAGQLREARTRLQAILPKVDAVWADSEFNARELRELGAGAVHVLPLVFEPKALDLPPQPEVLVKFRTRLTTFLFVGRIAPNKRIESLIEAYYWYYKTINPFSRLVLVGSDRSCPRYFTMLRMYAGDLDLPNVCFEGFASPAGLVAYYRSSDVFITTSAHEGYCLPLLEAMQMEVPVVAPAIGGIPEAMGGAGVMTGAMKPVELAGVMDLLARKGAVRGEVLASQRRRINELGRRDVDGELRQLMAGLVGPVPPRRDREAVHSAASSATPYLVRTTLAGTP